MNRALALLAVAVAVLLGPAHSTANAHGGRSSAVTPWIELELGAIASHRTNPPRAARGLAHLSSAMYLAALANGSARDDAVSGAASTVLVYLHPDEADRIAALADELADVDSRAFARGRVIGRLLVARAQRDGSDAVWTGRPPEGPGFWVPTPPGFVYPPLEPLAGSWRTWNLRRGSQFRPALRLPTAAPGSPPS